MVLLDTMGKSVLDKKRGYRMTKIVTDTETNNCCHSVKACFADDINDRLGFYEKISNTIKISCKEEETLTLLCVHLHRNNFSASDIESMKSHELMKIIEGSMSDLSKTNNIFAQAVFDEIYVLLQGLNNKLEIDNAIMNVKNVLDNQLNINDETYVSIGCAIYPFDGGNAESLIRNATDAASQARMKEGNAVKFHSDIKDNGIFEKHKLSCCLKYAIKNNELELYYQPQVDSRDESIVGLEALLRWNHPTIGIIGPEKFIPIAEETSQIVEIGEWVIRTACQQNKYWQDKGLQKMPVSINLSPQQFEDGKITEMIGKILNETSLKPEYLEVEITESHAIREIGKVVKQLEKLRKLGIGVAIDDFGMAYSSLNYIKQLPVDTIKIDKNFVIGVGTRKQDETIAKMIISLIHQLNLKAVAEGTTTKQQVEFLQNEGCNIVQGYYYYRPMSSTQVEKLLTDKNGIRRKMDQHTNINKLFDIEYLDGSIAYYLEEIGIKHSSKGYRYLVCALKNGSKNPRLLSNIRNIYTNIADEYETNEISVERAIRYALLPFRTTNKEFISRAVDNLALYKTNEQYKSYRESADIGRF